MIMDRHTEHVSRHAWYLRPVRVTVYSQGQQERTGVRVWLARNRQTGRLCVVEIDRDEATTKGARISDLRVVDEGQWYNPRVLDERRDEWIGQVQTAMRLEWARDYPRLLIAPGTTDESGMRLTPTDAHFLGSGEPSAHTDRQSKKS